jgi:hypothetical protein
MCRFLPGALMRGTASALVALLFVGCRPEYREPRFDEPHALVKVRLAYHAWPGPQLDQDVSIDRRSVLTIPVPVVNGSGVVTRPVMVSPGVAPWFFRSAFFHTFVVTRTETYMTTDSYPCGTAMCSTSTPQTRMVTDVVRVNDGTCETGMGLMVRPSESYIVQYDFFGDRRCSLHCYREITLPDGAPGTAPCEFAMSARPHEAAWTPPRTTP